MPITFPHIYSLWRSRLLHCSPPLVLTSLVSPGFTQGLRRVSLLRAKPHREDSTFGVSPCFPEKQETRTTAFSRESEVLSRTVWLTERHGKKRHLLCFTMLRVQSRKHNQMNRTQKIGRPGQSDVTRLGLCTASCCDLPG